MMSGRLLWLSGYLRESRRKSSTVMRKWRKCYSYMLSLLTVSHCATFSLCVSSKYVLVYI